ncbi:hypothetical protein HAX54_014425, partial [Datura stramonium]|nr:hypothetical protein [Datura stramonium]
ISKIALGSFLGIFMTKLDNFAPISIWGTCVAPMNRKCLFAARRCLAGWDSIVLGPSILPLAFRSCQPAICRFILANPPVPFAWHLRFAGAHMQHVYLFASSGMHIFLPPEE